MFRIASVHIMISAMFCGLDIEVGASWAIIC